MADRRTYDLGDAPATAGYYLPVDKSGNMELLKYPLASLLPSSIYRFNVESVTSGEVQITFLEAFPVGTNYDFLPISGYSTDFGYMYAIPYDKTVTGFKINFGEAVTFVYLAIIIR